MIENFKINSSEIDKIKIISDKDKKFRLKNLELFNSAGFPTKSLEDWKFSDLKNILIKNFKSFNINKINSEINFVNFIKDFDHNYILLINGKLYQSDFKFENKDKVIISNYHEEDFPEEKKINSMLYLNHALSNEGFSLIVKDNYKFKKVLIIYNIFTEDLNSNILNNKNKIFLGKNSEAHTIEYTINKSHNKFVNNTYENIFLDENSIFKNINIHANKSDGYFHKFSKNILQSNSNYSTFIFTSGLKFNKVDMEFNLEGENSDCNLRSALFLDKDDHQEIKTKINHLVPNCKSFQKVKSVLDSEGKGVYQGKIYVKDIAQKTNAYQLSKALLLSENSEFNSKPELEIYADDVKCSHGSTSGNVDDNSVHYLMTRGLTRKQSIQLLINGFLNEVIGEIKNKSIREFVENKMELQIYGY